MQLKENIKIWKWNDYHEMDRDEERCREKDENSPKLLVLKSQNQQRKINNEIGEEIQEMKY